MFVGSLCHQAVDTVSKGLIADLVPPQKQSIASAISIFWTSFGAVFGLVGQLIIPQHHTNEAYFVFQAIVVVTTLAMFAVVREKSSLPKAETNTPTNRAVIHGIASVSKERIKEQAQGLMATVDFAKRVATSAEDRDFMLCFWLNKI